MCSGEARALRRCDHVPSAGHLHLLGGVKSLISQGQPLTSPVGIILAIVSLAVMPTLAFVKQRVGKEMGSRAGRCWPLRCSGRVW